MSNPVLSLCIFVAWFLVSCLLWHYSSELLTYCKDDATKAVHWPLTYTKYAAKGQSSNVSSGDQFQGLSTALYSTTALLNRCLVLFFATLWASDCLLSTLLGETYWTYFCALLAWPYQKLTGKESCVYPIVTIMKRWFIDAQVITILALLLGATTISLANLEVVIKEQTAIGEMVYEEHFTAAVRHYSLMAADRRLQNETDNKKIAHEKLQVNTTGIHLLRQLQRLQATLECCGLNRGIEDFRINGDPKIDLPQIVPASCCGRLDPKPNAETDAAGLAGYNAREQQWIQWLVENPLANCSRFQVPETRNAGCQAKLTAAYLRPVFFYMLTFLPLQLCMGVLLAVRISWFGLKGRVLWDEINGDRNNVYCQVINVTKSRAASKVIFSSSKSIARLYT